MRELILQHLMTRYYDTDAWQEFFMGEGKATVWNFDFAMLDNEELLYVYTVIAQEGVARGDQFIT